jgi:hypothetical protein
MKNYEDEEENTRVSRLLSRLSEEAQVGMDACIHGDKDIGGEIIDVDDLIGIFLSEIGLL